MPVRIDDWYIYTNADGYKAPEQLVTRLVGKIKDHPNWHDTMGPRTFDPPKVMCTSRVESVEGNRVVKTASGTEYFLGDVNASYLSWMLKREPDWDPENPFDFEDGENEKIIMSECCCKELESFLDRHDGPLYIGPGTMEHPPTLNMVGYKLTPKKKSISLLGRDCYEISYCPFCGGEW